MNWLRFLCKHPKKTRLDYKFCVCLFFLSLHRPKKKNWIHHFDEWIYPIGFIWDIKKDRRNKNSELTTFFSCWTERQKQVCPLSIFVIKLCHSEENKKKNTKRKIIKSYKNEPCKKQKFEIISQELKFRKKKYNQVTHASQNRWIKVTFIIVIINNRYSSKKIVQKKKFLWTLITFKSRHRLQSWN